MLIRKTAIDFEFGDWGFVGKRARNGPVPDHQLISLGQAHNFVAAEIALLLGSSMMPLSVVSSSASSQGAYVVAFHQGSYAIRKTLIAQIIGADVDGNAEIAMLRLPFAAGFTKRALSSTSLPC